MITEGSSVRIREPFTAAFPDVYVVSSTDGTTAFLDGIPEGFANAFDFDHLEVVAP